MAENDSLHLEARDIPIPDSVSPEARAFMARGPLDLGYEFPDLNDVDGWHAVAAGQDARLRSFLGDPMMDFPGTMSQIDVDGVRVYELLPASSESDDPRVLLDIHGGGFFTGGGELCYISRLDAVLWNGVRTWAVDYRMPPDHPYPVPLDDCVRVYQRLVQDRGSANIIVYGSSAGGNLAVALILRARDDGLPLPAAAVLRSPQLDLTESGDTFATNLGLDSVLTRSLMPQHLLYAAGHDLADPYLSPLFADFSQGFPATLLTTGTRDLFLSNTVRFHRALRDVGMEADLHVTEAAGHAGFSGSAPEDKAIEAEIQRFLAKHWSVPA